MDVLKWVSWALSIAGLLTSTYAAILLYQGAPTLDDAFDLMMTTGAITRRFVPDWNPLETYNRATKRQEEMRKKSRRGVICLIVGFVIQGIAVVMQVP